MISSCFQFGIGGEFGLNSTGGYTFTWNSAPSLGAHSIAMSNGRATLALIGLYIREKTTKNTILLPSYLCHSVIQPFEEQGFEIGFYPVDFNLSVSPTTIAKYITEETSAVVMHHYFGFEQSSSFDSSLYSLHPDVLFIDDRTHLLLKDLQYNSVLFTNQIAIYSARKWAAFPDLAFIRCPSEDIFKKLKTVLPEGYDYSFSATRWWALIIRTLFYWTGNDFLRKQSLPANYCAEAVIDQRVLANTAFPASLWLWEHWDWRVVIEQRRQNYKFLLAHWNYDNPHIQPLRPHLDTKTVPLGFPIIITQSNRNYIRKQLIQHNIYPPIHWILPSRISPESFPQSVNLSQSIMTLPIDQRYKLEDMRYMLQCISKLEY